MSDHLIKRRFFHSTPVRIPVSHCYDFIIYPKGLLKSFPKVQAGQNILGLLHCLARHMSIETNKGKTTDFKDVAQTFWPSQAYLGKEIGCPANRISEAITVLVENGVLLKSIQNGRGQRLAFTSEVIHLWKQYSAKQHQIDLEDFDDAPDEPVKPPEKPYSQPEQLIRSSDVTHPLVGCDALRSSDVTHPLGGCGSIIEDKENDSGKLDSVNPLGVINSMATDGAPKSNTTQHGEGEWNQVVSIAHRIEDLFPARKNGYKHWLGSNMAVAEFVVEHGMQEAENLAKWSRHTFPSRRLKAWNDSTMEKVIQEYLASRESSHASH